MRLRGWSDTQYSAHGVESLVQRIDGQHEGARRVQLEPELSLARVTAEPAVVSAVVVDEVGAVGIDQHVYASTEQAVEVFNFVSPLIVSRPRPRSISLRRAMSRTDRAKLAYLVTLLLLGALAWGVLHVADYALGVGLLLALLFLIPGRLQGVVFRELFRGRRALDQGDPVAAIGHFEAFLARLDDKPSRQRAVWLAAWVYTPSARAMAHNNLAVAALELGRFRRAEQEADRALAIDPLYPLPWVQRAVVAAARDQPDEVRRAMREARRLGYRGDTVDEIVARAQRLLARAEGSVTPS
jgi:tetratricopeptide (TPR) repeat protein